MSDKASYKINFLQRISIEKPILTCVVLLVIVLFFKWVDTWVLRLDERLGEIILCKTLGFALVILFVLAAGRRLRDIGFHSRRLGQCLLIGVTVTAIAIAVAYVAEFVGQLQNQPVVHFEAIDPKAGVRGGFYFILWMILGNVINSFMEEGLFRGVMTRLFRVRFSFWWANVFQAFLFALWHLPWVLKWYQTGQIEAHGGLVMATISQFLPMFLMGLVWGYLYLKTGSLWVSWVAHLFTNTIFNLVHITTSNGLDSGMPIRGLTSILVALVSLILVKYWAERSKIPEVKPWGQWDTCQGGI